MSIKTQTVSNKYEGECKFCHEEFPKRTINKHLDTCEKRITQCSNKVNNLRLKILDKYMKNFWFIVEVTKDAKFSDLDTLIRDIWVDCCSHMSSFDPYGEKIGMRRKIMDVLSDGEKIDYLYDWGSSTELMIEATSYSNFALKDKIELVARNYLPPSPCVKCKKQAYYVCSECMYDGEAAFCKKCAKSHKCGEDMLLQIGNSPRTGVCGYDGNWDFDKLF